jgi:hypothetical protein
MAIPFTFSPNTLAQSAQVNANFTYLNGLISSLIPSTSNITLSIILSSGKIYGAGTSSGALTVTLPAISASVDGTTIWIFDVDNNASSNNVTINAQGSDAINLYSTSSGSLTIDVNGGGAMFVVRSGAWRAIPFTS